MDFRAEEGRENIRGRFGDWADIRPFVAAKGSSVDCCSWNLIRNGFRKDGIRRFWRKPFQSGNSCEGFRIHIVFKAYKCRLDRSREWSFGRVFKVYWSRHSGCFFCNASFGIQEYGRGFSLHEAYCRKYFRVNGRDKRSFDPYRGYLSYQDEIGRLEADGGNGDRVFRAFRDTEPAAARTGCESAVRGSLRFLSFHNGFHSHRTHFGTQNA